MLLELLSLAPYLAIGATASLATTIAAVWLRSGPAPRASGFNFSRQRRRVSYRGPVCAPRRIQFQDAA